jgi:hypothetical protein
MPSNIVSLNKRFGRQRFKHQTEIKCENVGSNFKKNEVNRKPKKNEKKLFN